MGTNSSGSGTIDPGFWAWLFGGRNARAGHAFAGAGEVFSDLTWVWVTVIIVGLGAGLFVWLRKKL